MANESIQQLQVNNSRGMGFALYAPDSEHYFTSETDIFERLDEIPLNYYIVINNTNDENHGNMYKKIYSGDQYTAVKITNLAKFSANTVLAEDLHILGSLTGDDSNVQNFTFKDFIDTLRNFFENI